MTFSHSRLATWEQRLEKAALCENTEKQDEEAVCGPSGEQRRLQPPKTQQHDRPDGDLHRHMLSLSQDLLGHEDKQPPEALLRWSVLAVLGSEAYNAGLRRQVQSPPGSTVLHAPLDASSVFKWLCRVAVNGVALRPVTSARGGGGGGGREGWGTALFPVAACFNHSCQPNVVLRCASTGAV